MIGRNVLEEDILLKQYAHASDKDKPRFNWSDFAQEEAPELPGKLQIKIETVSYTHLTLPTKRIV